MTAAHDGRRAGRSGRRRSGFALVEMMTVLLVAGALTRIAAPNLEVMRVRARAADILGEIRAVETAATDYHLDTDSWPRETENGHAPEELEGYLPEGFSFLRDGHSLAWNRWELPDGLPGHPGSFTLVAVTVSLEDEQVGAALLELAGETRSHLTVDHHHTFLVAGD